MHDYKDKAIFADLEKLCDPNTTLAESQAAVVSALFVSTVAYFPSLIDGLLGTGTRTIFRSVLALETVKF